MEANEFTLNGKRYRLTRDQVIAAMRNQIPGRIQVHGVDIEGRYFPVKQVLAQALQVPRSEFISTRAVELLRKVGLRVVDTDMNGQIEPARELGSSSATSGELRVRKAALELAVLHLSSSDGPVDSKAVLDLAERFQSWLASS